MLKSETKQIGDRGYSYTVEQFGARQGGRVLIRLAKMLGKPIGDAVSAGNELDVQTIGRLLAGLSASVNEADYDYLCDVFLAKTHVSGGDYGARIVPLSTGGMFDLHFGGAYAELGEWILFAVEVNYGSFLAVAGGKAKDLGSALQVSDLPGVTSPSPSPTDSKRIGRSGESQAQKDSPRA